jgi:hypothetical protein
VELALDLTADVGRIITLHGIEQAASDELEAEMFVVAHEIEALGLELIFMLI